MPNYYERPQLEVFKPDRPGSGEDHYFKMRMRSAGWDIRDDETVTDFIKRNGHPFTITYEGMRRDN